MAKKICTYDGLFKLELGTYKNEKTQLEIENNARAIFHKPHPIRVFL